MSYRRLSEPFFTQHDTGHITAHWPDPTQDSYEVAHEIVQQAAERYDWQVWRILRKAERNRGTNPQVSTDGDGPS